MRDHLPWSGRSWLATSHVVADCFVAIAAWVVVVVLVLVGLFSIPAFGLGIPILWAGLRLGARFAAGERRRIATFLDVHGLEPAPRDPPRGTWPHLWHDLRESAAWRAVAYYGVLLPLGTLGIVVVLLLWSVGFGLASMPFWHHFLPSDPLWHLSDGLWPWLWTATGVVALLVVPWVAEAFVGLDVALARRLLAASEAERLAARVETLTETRTAAVASADSERRRIERDLHDGAQPQLVALAMNLGMAKAKMADDPEAAAALVAQAHEQAKEAAAELRRLARGIHPAVLTDRGLDAALSALAANAPVPVSVTARLQPRPPADVEAVAYFVVAEALTNVAKHAAATRATVHAVREGPLLRLRISDDGRGGANEQPGGGLAGLRGRVAAVDGRMDVDSPAGGPTTITVEIPCES